MYTVCIAKLNRKMSHSSLKMESDCHKFKCGCSLLLWSCPPPYSLFVSVMLNLYGHDSSLENFHINMSVSWSTCIHSTIIFNYRISIADLAASSESQNTCCFVPDFTFHQLANQFLFGFSYQGRINPIFPY